MLTFKHIFFNSCNFIFRIFLCYVTFRAIISAGFIWIRIAKFSFADIKNFVALK